MEPPNPRYYKFGDYKIDSRRRVLSKNDGEIPISAKNFELLFELVKNEGRILSHDELLDTVWEGTFVEQSNLKKGISAIRHILGESPESSNYIKTIPRKGYCFVATVQTSSEEKLNESIHITATEIIIEEEIIEDDEPLQNVKFLPAPIPSTSFWQRYNKYILGGLGVLFLGTLAFSFNRFFVKKAKRFSAESVKITKLTNDGNCYDASISADGNFILCGTFSSEGNGLVTRQVSVNSQVQVVPPQKDTSFWAYRITPDGNSVYYIIHNEKDASQNGLFQVSFLGGTPRKISSKANASITFSPDNKKLAFIRIEGGASKIVTMNLDGSDENILTEYGQGFRLWGLNWSPDGKSILCNPRIQTDEKFRSFAEDISLIDGSKTVVLPEQEKLIVGATWMPDKESMLLALRELNSETRQIWQYFPATNEFLRVTNDNNTYRFIVLNQAGTIISTTQESTVNSAYLGEVGSKETRQLSNQMEKFGWIWWANNNRLVYDSFEEGRVVISTINSDGTNKQAITDGKDGIDLYPRISTDLNSVVFSSLRTGARTLWRVNLDGSGLTQLTPNSADIIFEGRLLADNKTLIGLTQNKNEFFLWKQTADGEKIKLVQTGVGNWDISPDDKLLICYSFDDETRKNQIEIRSVENNQILQTFKGDFDKNLRWVDEKSFIYSTRKGGKTQIFKQALDKTPPTLIYEYNGQNNETVSSFNFASDGKKFVFVRGKYMVDAVTIKVEETK